MKSQPVNVKNREPTYSSSELGCTLKVQLTKNQKEKVNHWLGCIRKVKNNKINEINQHNQQYLNTELYNQFKLANLGIENNQNPYQYVPVNQGYALSKNTGLEFIGPLQEEVYNTIYKNGKHYLERVPSELYRNSMKDLMQGNSKYIADVFNKNINYINKRKPLNFISKNKSEESMLLTSSDHLFKFVDGQLQIGKNFEQSYQIEQEIKFINKKLAKKNMNKDLRLILEKQLEKLTKKLDKDYSYLGLIKYKLPKVNKTSKKIDFNSIKSIRIKKDKKDYFITFSYNYHHEYMPTLLRLDNNKELTTMEELAWYIKELTEKEGKEVALHYLKERTLGKDRGIVQRVTVSSGKHYEENELNNKEQPQNNFFNYSEEIKRLIIKLEKGIKYHQKQCARRTKGSKGYEKSSARIRKNKRKIANIKLNENHQVTHQLVNDYNFPIFAIEKLNLKGMTKKPLPKIDINQSLTNKYNVKLGLTKKTIDKLVEKLTEYYKENKSNLKFKDIVGDYKLVFDKNKSSAKAGLNKAMLNQNLGQFSELLDYKSKMNGKLMIEVPAYYSSQECCQCGCVEAKNRTKTKFCCVQCGYKDHADSNASKVIAGRVYQTLMKLIDKLVAKETKEKLKLLKENKKMMN